MPSQRHPGCSLLRLCWLLTITLHAQMLPVACKTCPRRYDSHEHTVLRIQYAYAGPRAPLLILILHFAEHDGRGRTRAASQPRDDQALCAGGEMRGPSSTTYLRGHWSRRGSGRAPHARWQASPSTTWHSALSSTRGNGKTAPELRPCQNESGLDRCAAAGPLGAPAARSSWSATGLTGLQSAVSRRGLGVSWCERFVHRSVLHTHGPPSHARFALSSLRQVYPCYQSGQQTYHEHQ